VDTVGEVRKAMIELLHETHGEPWLVAARGRHGATPVDACRT
jgi:hypothetical protein